MPYRGDPDPLKVNETALENELSFVRKRERTLVNALEEARAALRQQRTLPVLDDVRIASPCSARWEEMTGDARVRFCGKCAKNVYNLSEMSREEAERLLARTEGGMCVRLYRRKDGTVMTADCPTGVKRKRVRRVLAVAATAGAGAMATMALASVAVMGRPQMGDVGPATVGAVIPTTTTVHGVDGKGVTPPEEKRQATSPPGPAPRSDKPARAAK